MGDVYVMDEMQDIKYWWEETYLKSYPETDDQLWEKIAKVSPEHVLVPYEGMPDCVAGELTFVFKDGTKNEYHDIIRQIRELEENMDKQAEKMLCRLAAVRLWMWT